MTQRRTMAATFTILFLAAAMAPLASVTAESWEQGDVVINGAFRDPTPVGHPLKAYCDPYNPAGPGAEPTGNCPGNSTFVAYDWTAPVGAAGNIALVEGGIRLAKGPEVFIQQHFNGSNNADTDMNFYGVTVTAKGETGPAKLRIDIRTGSGTKTAPATFSTSGSTVFIAPETFGYQTGESLSMRSVRLWLEGTSNVTIERVQVHARTTFPLNLFSPFVSVGGDDTLTTMGSAVLHGPGADGKYTWNVQVVDDSGAVQPLTDAVLCVYPAEDRISGKTFGNGGKCPTAIVTADQAAQYDTRTRTGVRFDIPVELVEAKGTFPQGFLVFASVAPETKGLYANERGFPGFYNAGQAAAVAAGAGAARNWSDLPTPVLFDRDSNFVPDYVENDELDGYSVIVTPVLATQTPGATIVTPGLSGSYEFDLSVYRYPTILDAPASQGRGERIPLDLARLQLGVFTGDQLAAPGAPAWNLAPVASVSGSSMTLSADGLTARAALPKSAVPAYTPMGAWGYYNVPGSPTRHTATETPFGPADSAFDVYSVLRNAVQENIVADGLRNAGTVVIFDSGSASASPTLAIRMNASADNLTALDGTIVAGDKGDGTITFEYAFFDASGKVHRFANAGQAIGIYDAAGVASDQFNPGAAVYKHAAYVTSGTDMGDGWYQANIPVSEFEDLKGAAYAYAYVTDQATGVGKATFYNFLKPAVASVAPLAAEKALYVATPIVVLDQSLGIPMALESTINGAGTDLLSLTNPLLNPGFEADAQVEGERNTTDSSGAVMTAPPWFLRLDDKGGSTYTTPKSTHAVVYGAGTVSGTKTKTNAMRVNYQAADQGKGLHLGQLLGVQAAKQGLVWMGATGASFDVMPKGTAPVTLWVSIHSLDGETGEVRVSDVSRQVMPSSTWTKVNVEFTGVEEIGPDDQLLGFYVAMSSTASQFIFFDNFAIKGAQTALGDARSDLSDGFSTIIEPRGLDGATQGTFSGTDGEYYVYNVSFVDYRDVTPRVADLEGVATAFALRTQNFEAPMGSVLRVRGSTDGFVAAVKAGEEPAPAAVPWAFADFGPAYQSLFIPADQQPASGYYSPVKNAMRASPLADQLDYDAVPVAFGTDSLGSIVGAQSLRTTTLPGGFGVVLATTSPFVETVTVTVSRPNAAPQTFDVATEAADGNLVPGLFLSAADLEVVTVTSEATSFSTGDVLVPGSPVPSFEVCRPIPGPCSDVDVLTRETLTFRSTSTSPAGAAMTYFWNFSGTTRTTSAPETTFAFASSGPKTITLTVKAANGGEASIPRTIYVNNQAPVLNGIDVNPTQVFVDTLPVIRARATDDQTSPTQLAYTWRLDGNAIASVTGRDLPLNAAVLAEAFGPGATLEKRAYNVSVDVSDGVSQELVTGFRTFSVQDRPSALTLPAVSVRDFPTATYALVGEAIHVELDASDADDATMNVTLLVDDGVAPTLYSLEQRADGVYATNVSVANAGLAKLSAVATTPSGVTTGPIAAFLVKVDSAPVVTIAGDAATDAFEAVTYAANASDPDARGPVALAWTVDGASVPGAQSITYTWTGMGSRVVQVVATQGALSTTATKLVTVDDAIQVTLQPVHLAENLTDGQSLRVRVTNVHGVGIGNIPVKIEDFYDPIPAAMTTRTVYTNSDGVATFRLAPEGAGVVGLPLAHTVKATASAASVAGAPVMDVETGTATFSFENTQPFAGLPLP